MISTHSSPKVGSLSLHSNSSPHLAPSMLFHHSSKELKLPSSCRLTGSNTSSGLLLDSDGELHDPGYTESLKQLKAQMEAESTLNIGLGGHMSGHSSPRRRKSALARQPRRPSLLSGPPADWSSYEVTSDAEATGGASSSDDDDSDELEGDFLDRVRSQRMRQTRSTGGTRSTFSSASSLSPGFLQQQQQEQRRRSSNTFLTVPSLTALPPANSSAPYWSTASEPGNALIDYPHVSPAPSTVSSPRLGAVSLARRGSKQSSKRQHSQQQQQHSVALDDWQGGFTGIVDMEREASRSGRTSADIEMLSTSSDAFSRPTSPGAVSSISRGSGSDQQSITQPSGRPDKASTSSLKRLGSGITRRGGSQRRSSDGVSRPGLTSANEARHLTRRPSFDPSVAMRSLRKSRSESAPQPFDNSATGKGASMVRALTDNDDVEPLAAPTFYEPSTPSGAQPTKRLSPILSGQSSHAANSDVTKFQGWRFSSSGPDPLTPLAEDGGFPQGQLFGSVSSSQKAAAAADSTNREKSHLLPLLGRRPSPIAVYVGSGDDASGGGGGGYGDVAPADESTTKASLRDGDALRSMKRTMQSLSLGVKFKAMDAERRWRRRFGSNGAEASEETDEAD